MKIYERWNCVFSTNSDFLILNLFKMISHKIMFALFELLNILLVQNNSEMVGSDYGSDASSGRFQGSFFDLLLIIPSIKEIHTCVSCN